VKISLLIPKTLGGPDDNIWNRAYYMFYYRHIENRNYKPFLDLVSELHPQRILEIGVAQGWGTERMIKASGRNDIEYYGFDLFNQDARSPHSPASMSRIRKKLKRLGIKEIHLFKGDSRKTLPSVITTLPKMDFIYIDGDHSYEGARADWKNAKKLMHKNTVVVFDDYHSSKKYGVKRAVDEIKGYRVGFIRIGKRGIQAKVQHIKREVKHQ